MNMDSLIQSAPNHVFAKSIIDSFSTLNWQNFLHVLPKVICQAGLILFIKYLFEKGSIEIFSTIYKSLFYVELTFSKSDINSINYYIADAIAKHVKPNEIKGNYNGIEINVSKNDVKITVPRFIGRFLITGSLLEAKNSFNTYIKNKNNKLTMYKKNALTLDPSDQFPSRNDLSVERIVVDFFETAHCIGHKTLCLRINGRPGLGKSCLANYLAYKKICHKVIRLDLSCMVKMEFSSIVKQNFEDVIHQDTVIMLDEIDKYLDENIRIRFQNQKDMSYDDFSKNARREFLFQVLEILEIDCMGGSLVLIICTNNFETIFSKVEMTHHRSFLDRMTVINFEQCDKIELMNYFNFVNDKLKKTKFYVKMDKLEKILNDIKDDVQIPFRQVFFISQKNSFNYEKIVRDINEWIESDYSDECLDETSQVITRTNVEIESVGREKNDEKCMEKIHQITDFSIKDDDKFNILTNEEKFEHLIREMYEDNPYQALNKYLPQIDVTCLPILVRTIHFWHNDIKMLEKIINVGAIDIDKSVIYDLITYYSWKVSNIKNGRLNAKCLEVIKYITDKGFCVNYDQIHFTKIQGYILDVIYIIDDHELLEKLVDTITSSSINRYNLLLQQFISLLELYDIDGIIEKFVIIMKKFSDINMFFPQSSMTALDYCYINLHIVSADKQQIDQNLVNFYRKIIHILESLGAKRSKIIPDKLKTFHYMLCEKYSELENYKSIPYLPADDIETYIKFIENYSDEPSEPFYPDNYKTYIGRFREEFMVD